MNNDFFSGPFKPQPAQTSIPAPKKGGLAGFLENTVRGIAHPFAELGTAIALTPKAISREIQNKPIDDVQKRAFGTNDQGDIAKKIIGDTAQVGLNFALPEAGSIGKQAALGAGFGASSALAQDKSSLKSVLEGGATGGLVGGAVGAGSNILGKLTGGVESAVDKGATKIAGKQAEKDTIEKAAQAAEEESPYSAINKGGRERTNMRSTLDFFKNKLGMGTDPTALRAGADLATGENGVISGTMRKLLGDTGNVATSKVMDSTKAALIKEAGQLGDVEAKGSHANGVLRSVRDTLQGTAYKGEGNLSKTGNADANAVFDTLKNVETRIQELGDVGADAAEKRALKATKGALEDSIYKSGSLDKAVSGYKLAPEDIIAIHEAAQKSGVSPQAAQHIIDGINNATSGQELRSLQAPFVNGSKLANAAGRAGEGVLTDIPKASSEAPGFFTGRGGRYNALEIASVAGGNPIMGIPLAANLAASAGDKATGVIQNAGEKLVNAGQRFNSAPGGTNNILARLVTQTGATNLAQPQTPEQPQVLADQSTTPQSSNLDFSAPQTDSSPFGAASIQKAIIEDMAKNEGKNVSTLLALYKTFGQADQPTAAEQKSTVAAKNAEGTLGQIEDSFNAAGGGKGKVGGFLSNLAGKTGLNSNVATYNDTATALAASLYKALGNTGTISDKDQQLISKLIPKTTDTETTAQAKIAQLENLLQQATQNAQQSFAGVGL